MMMQEQRKRQWPVLAQVLLAFGLASALYSIYLAVEAKDWKQLVFGILIGLLWWNCYLFRRWAYIGINSLFIVNVMMYILAMAKGTSAMLCLLGIVFSILILYYFNSTRIRQLF